MVALFDSILRAAQLGAARAGKMAENVSALPWEGKSNRFDIVSTGDLESQEAIIGVLQSEQPELVIVAEEGSAAKMVLRESLTGIVDPLDGSTNYMSGEPNVAVSIGVMLEHKPLMGVVADVFGGNVYCANASGRPYILRPDRTTALIKPNTHNDVSKRMLFYDFPSDKKRMPLMREFLKKAEGNMHPPRSIGCAVLALTRVALGIAGGYANTQLFTWDVAGAYAILERLGYIVTDWHGNPWQPHEGPHGVIVGTQETHPQLLEWAQESMFETSIDPANVR